MKKKNVYFILTFYLLFCWCNTSYPSQIQVGVIIDESLNQHTTALLGLQNEIKNNNISLKIINATDIKTQENAIKKLNYIITFGSKNTLNLAKLNINIPIIFSMVLDSHPFLQYKDNIIGGIALKIPVKYVLQTIKDVVPKARNIGVFSSDDSNLSLIKDIQKKVKIYDYNLKIMNLKQNSPIPEYNKKEIDVLWLIPDEFICRTAILKRIFMKSLRLKIPIIGISPSYVQSGALFCLSPNYFQIGKITANFLNSILINEKAKSFKVIYPDMMNINIYINTFIAKKLDMDISRQTYKKAILVGKQ